MTGNGRDAPGREQLQEELRASEERYQQLFEQHRAIMLVIDPGTGSIVDANRAAEAFYGYPAGELRRMCIEDINALPPDEVAEDRAKALREERNFFDFPHRLADGTIRTVEVHSSPVEIGGARLLYSTIEDVTPRQHSEAALRESEARYRLLVDESPNAIAIHQNGRIVFVNRAAIRLMGAETAAELHGLPISTVVHPDEWESVKERIGRLLQGETGLYPNEERFVRLDGSELQVEVTSAPCTFGGRPALQVIVTDISDRKQAETALRESEERYRTILNSSPDAVVITNIEGRVEVYSSAALTMFGSESGEGLSGKAITDFVVPQDRERALANIVRMAERNKNRSERAPDVYRAVRADGSSFHVEVMGEFIRNTGGQVTGMVFDVRDITERKRVEQALMVITKAVESASDAIGISDVQGHHFYQNKALSDLFGYATAEELEAAGGGRAVVHDPGVGETMFANIMSGKSWAGELEMVTKSGRVFPAYERADAIKDDDGRIIGLIGIITDISERKRIEEALRDGEERFRDTFEEAAVGIAHVGLDGRWLRVNRNLCDIVGYTREELLQMSFQEITHPDDLPTSADALRQLVAGSISAHSAEKRYVRKDGSPVWVDLTVSFVRDASGEPLYSISVIEDISARKQAEQALRESENGLREAQRLAHVGSWQWDVATDTVTWSEELFRINGRDPRLPAPRYVEMAAFYTPESWERLSATVARALEDGEPYELELEHVLPEGTTRLTLTRGGVDLDPNGRVVRLFGTVQDITERKRAEAERERLENQLRQSQKLEAVGQLAAGIAHDFNNKLAVILGSADMAMAVLDQADEMRTDIQEIRTAALRSADLTRQLLAFARMQPIAPKQLDLNETVESMLSMLRRLTGEGVSMEWLPDPKPCRVQIDPSQVDQVLVNLVVNARDATSGNGTVMIATSAVEVAGDHRPDHVGVSPGRYVVLEVRDDGHGMDEATKARIFEPFFTTKPQGQGTGLGMATVYGIAQQNGGFVAVESEPGKGTTVKFYLPEESARGGADDKLLQAPGSVGDETVLLVEDEPVLLRLTAKMLAQQGFAVLAAENPVEAVQIAAEHSGNIDLLVTDVVMPGMNGAELNRQVKALHPGLRCLFVSGYPASVLAGTGVLDDGVELLPKPFTQESLALKLRKVLARE